MTRKDYIKIADCLVIFFSTNSNIDKNILYGLTDNFCDMLKNDNVRFNQERFIEYINSKLSK